MPRETPRERLGRTIRAERTAQRLSQRALADRAGVAPLTVLYAEKGRPAKLRTLLAIERALGWEDGTAEAVLAGASPPEPGTSRPPAPREAAEGGLAERLARIEAKLDAILTLIAGGARGPL